MNEDFDISAEDREGRPVLVVRVKYDEATEDDFWEILRGLDGSPETIRFGMLVDPESIRIFRRDLEHPDSVAELDTTEVLSHYSPRYGESKAHRGFKPIFRIYLTGITTAWLSDLAGRWKEGEPPQVGELRRIGLLEKLEGGMVVREDSVRDRSLS